MRKRMLFIFVILIVIGSSSSIYATIENVHYQLTINEDKSTTFTNHMDGYGVRIPFQAELSFDNFSNIAKLTSIYKNAAVTVMRQRFPLKSYDNSNVYNNYSHFFLKSTIDHQLLFRKKIRLNGYSAVITEWKREKLSGVANDMNYYCHIDLILSKNDIITFHCKSSRPIDRQLWIQMVNRIKLFPATAYRPIRKTELPPNRILAPETQSFLSQYFSEDASLTWGIFPVGYPNYKSILENVESKVDYRFPFILTYYGLGSNRDLNSFFQTAKEENRYVEFTLQTSLKQKNHNDIYNLLNGVFDEEIAILAQTIKKYERPVLFRLFNEMNGDWCLYSAHHLGLDTDIFKEAYRYVYRIFEKEGANVYALWVWNPNKDSFPNYLWNSESAYYPGDEYVDIIGLTAYNTGNYYPGEYWKSFSELYDDLYQNYVERYSQPLMITEFASASRGGDKVNWTWDMLSRIDAMKKIKVAVWWNGADYDVDRSEARTYFIDKPAENLIPFREYFYKRNKRE